MKNMAETLNQRIVEKKSAACVGLDPVLDKIPECYKEEYRGCEDEFKAVGNILFDFNKDVIDAVSKLIPVVKPQMAFYEQYGCEGIIAFKKTVDYAKSKGLVVVEDGKRNDIGNTAKAYADAHLGSVNLLTKKQSAFNVDWLTVSPFLGWDGIEPFIDVCAENGKGIFVLVKTSNSSSGEIQENVNKEGDSISIQLAKKVNEIAEKNYSKNEYSPIGAVVGATYPHEADLLRAIMPKSIFLVPGYGAQGGTAKDVMNCFNEDGLGAIVSASRSILYAYSKTVNAAECTKEQYKAAVAEAVEQMNHEIYNELIKTKKAMQY